MPALHVGTEDRRIDQVVQVFVSYDVTMAVLQDTKWLGDEVYSIGKNLVLTACRTVPRHGQGKKGGEGIALQLTGSAVSAGKAEALIGKHGVQS